MFWLADVLCCTNVLMHQFCSSVHILTLWLWRSHQHGCFNGINHTEEALLNKINKVIVVELVFQLKKDKISKLSVLNAWWWWWWIVFVVWLTDERCLALFPAGTIVRDPHHRESPTRCKQDLKLCRTWVQVRDKQFNNNLNWVIPPNDIVLIKNVIVTLLESVKENQAVLKNARCTGGVSLKVNRIPASGYGLWGKSDFLKLSFFLKWQKYVV